MPEAESESVTLSREDSPILRPFSDGLLIAYVVDDGDSYHYVQQRHLDKEGVTEEQLHEIGLRNLTALASSRDLRIQPYQNINAVLMGGDFEASLILLDQLWDHHFRQFVSGEYSIAIPARDILAFCDNAASAGVNELNQLIGRIYSTGDHPISDKIYVRRQNKWQTRLS